MSEAQAASGMDRLPWLADEPGKPAKASQRLHGLLGWAVAAVLLVAGTSFWLGTRGERPQPLPSQANKVPAPSATSALPPVRSAAGPQIAPAPAPEVHSAPVPEVHAAPRPAIHLTRVEAAAARRSAAERRVEAKLAAQTPAQAPPAPAAVTSTASQQAVPSHSAPLRPWQPRVVSGAAGRLVEVGAFGSVYQAKLGWRYMVRTYPAVSHLPAVVRPDRNSHGRIFYRFRVGTTSQAHSEVLCQRMQKIGLSCAVVGLPWKAKVER